MLSDAKLLRCIGKITIDFCNLEDELELGIASQLHDDCDEIGYLVTCKMSFQQKLKLYERLVSHRLVAFEKQNLLPNLKKLVKEMEEIRFFRNNVIHNIRFNDDGELFIRQNYKKSSINFNEDVNEINLPYKGMNSRYPKFKKIEISEKLLKVFLKRIEKTCNDIDKMSEIY